MAGKHPNYDQSSAANTADLTAAAAAAPPHFPGGRLDKTYAEARADGVAGTLNNPYATGTPQWSAYFRGYTHGFNSAPAEDYNGTEFHTGVPDQTA